MTPFARASVAAALPKISLINPAVTSSVSLPPIAPKPVKAFKAFLADVVSVTAIFDAFAAVTVSMSES